ncbi:MAG: methionyl-tRNA formyltransferase [Planctomycetota bacterium]
MRIVFFGSGAFGLPTLERLVARHTLLAVVTQPDRPAGRKKAMTPTPIGAWAQSPNPLISTDDFILSKPENVNDPVWLDRLRALPADAWVVIAFGQKIGSPLLEGRFAINLHASLLPRWRGAAPINHAILAGDEVTGNSVITLADRMDAGAVLGRSTRPIDPSVTTGDLHDLLAQDGPDLVEGVLAAHEAGTLDPLLQDESRVTLASKLRKGDGVIDFAQPADVCRNRIHGLNPWPGVTSTLNGEPIKLHRAKAIDRPHEQPAGALLDVEEGIVACAPGSALRLIEVQPPNRRAMAWEDFRNGASLTVGDRFSNAPRDEA